MAGGSSKKTVWRNNVTGEQSSLKPISDDADDTEIAHVLAAVSDEQSWTAFMDETTKLPYYYNRRTGETTWERPQEFEESGLPPESDIL